jgi:hypothetical protein
MLFLGLLIYVAAALLLETALLVLASPWRVPLWSAWFIGFPAACLLGLFIAYLIDISHEVPKQPCREMVRPFGSRGWAFTTVLVVGYVALAAGRTPIFWVLAPPAMLVSLLNAIGFDLPLKRLQEEADPGRVVLPQRPQSASRDEIVSDFAWENEARQFAMSLVIRRAIYDEFKSKPRLLQAEQWASEYVAKGIVGEVHDLAGQLAKMGYKYGTYSEVSFILSFVQQNVKYKSDLETTGQEEYPRYPVETLADKVGDCEDSAILAAAILKCLGYEVALFLMPGHCALGVAGAEGMAGFSKKYGDYNYYYCEMTAAGWIFGEKPGAVDGASIEVIPVPSIPAIVVRGTQDSAAA